GRLYVPCYDGQVDEVDPATGRLLGFYQLGQALSFGGVYDEEAGLLYLAADTFCVYALDLAGKRCAAILYSEHPAGSLRSEPALARGKGVKQGGPPACLILCLADSLEATRLRAYGLPIDRPDAAPLRLDLRLPGWSWFAPRQDGEKLALATDRGAVGLWGIR